MHRFLSVCDLTKIDLTKIRISTRVEARVMRFGMEMHMDAIWVDLEGQGHRSEVKVTGQIDLTKNTFFKNFVWST